MDRLAPILEGLKAFALTRPVAYGAPACAAVGALAGFLMQTGPRDANFTPEMEPAPARAEASAEPIAWPSGKVPDYVVGTDFLEATRPPPIQTAAYAPPPAPDPPPYEPGQHGPATPPPDPDSYGSPSRDGNILDVSLPEDHKPRIAPLVMADAAATGMTTR